MDRRNVRRQEAAATGQHFYAVSWEVASNKDALRETVASEEGRLYHSVSLGRTTLGNPGETNEATESNWAVVDDPHNTRIRESISNATNTSNHSLRS